MADLLLPGMLQYHEISLILIFRFFLGEIMMYRQDCDVITREFPLKLGNPPISFQNACSDTLLGTNDTCFVENFIQI